MKFSSEIEELVYLEYQGIDDGAFQEKIRYFERNKPAIKTLPYEVRLEMSLEYVVSHFEVGEYYQYLKHVDSLLSKVVEENIFSVDGDDIYQELLYRKAASLHNVLDFYGAEHVLKELYLIDSDSNLYKRTYIKNFSDRLRSQAQKARGIIIAMLGITGFIIGLELLVVRPFHPAMVGAVELSRNILFGSALLSLIGKEMYIRYLANRNLRELKK